MAVYDGAYWRNISIPNHTVRSLAMDDQGTIYVGGNNEIGYLAPTAKASLQYVSLLAYIKENQRNFGNVWKAHSTGKMIYFRTSRYLFGWNPVSREMRVWEPEDILVGSFVCNGNVYIFQRNVGLMQMVNDSPNLVPGGETFSKKWITVMAPYDSQRILIGTFSQGMYLYDGAAASPFPTAADEFLKSQKLYSGTGLALSPGDFSLGTLQGGMVIIDSRGRLKHLFNKAYGLQDQNVKFIWEDHGGNLWLALNNGITKIEYTLPISLHDSRSDLPGLVLAVVRHGIHNDLFAGTTSGLYTLDANGKFHQVPGVASMCWHLISTGPSLLAATSDGVFQVENDDHRQIITPYSFVLHRARQDPHRIWVGTNSGLVSLCPEKSSKNRVHRWVVEWKFEINSQDIHSIVEDQKGNLWLGTLTEGVFKVSFPGDPGEPVVSRYGTQHGLPRGEAHVFMAAGHMMVGTQQGLYRFDKKTRGFIPDTTLGSQFADGSSNVFRLKEDRDNNIWFHSNKRTFQAIRQANGKYSIYREPFLRISDIQVNSIYPDPSGDVTWFASHKGLIRFDMRIKKDYCQPYMTIIRKVFVNGSLVFDGYKGKALVPIIPYRDRNLRFEFAAPCFEAETRTRYRSFLEGYEKDWSDFSLETRRDYTNLDPGWYSFRVRAENVYQHEGSEAVFRFRILPPWYKTWWAFALYIGAALLLLYLVVRWRSGKLQREKQKLEQIVKERTTEIKEKNLQLEEQSQKLKEMDKVKSRFFANISHEFRTPLTLIIGPLEQMLVESTDKKQEKRLDTMLRNSQRLLTLINQLLELSKIDSGRMKLRTSPQSIVSFLKGILASFEYIAAVNKLELKFHTREKEIILYFDPEKMEKVFTNLVANAVRFTPAYGRVAIAVSREPETGNRDFPEGFVEISVEDTGAGIPREQLAHIFDRFYQAQGSSGTDHEGTGIGLSLVKELVVLHHGTIDAYSQEGQGTRFILRLPLGTRHLNKEEIGQAPESGFSPAPGRKSRIPLYITAQQETGESETNRGPDAAENGEEETKDEERDIILVVEDNSDVRQYIREPFDNGYSVVEAANGKEGIEIAKKIIPDLIISDIMMPEADGYQLCHTLKTDVKTSHIPVVLLTARGSEESMLRGLEIGADDYITKPFNSRILQARIKNLIDLRRQLQQKIQREMVLQPAEITVSPVDREFMKELKEVMEQNMSEPEFGVDQLAKSLYMSRTTLNRKIKALTGESTNQFIQSYRLKRGAQLLKENFGNVTEVAFEVGFSNSAYFTKCFKDKFHQLPHTFQASESEA
ncbi:MAG: response regulator [Candidatus Aminicenantes bacterium]